MDLQSNRKRLLTSTIIGGAMAAMALPAFAQDTGVGAAPSGQQTTVQEVVVTGSRIPRPNTTAISPIETVAQQEFKLEGTVDVETLLNNLPSVSPGSTQFNNGDSGSNQGIATVDLRGFGPDRTLVLMDGRRMPPGDAQQPVADLNLIPTSLVDRVDVLTGGAASIYGSDAISGVVNFVMKHNFQGLQIDTQYNFAQHDNPDPAVDGILRADGITPPSADTVQGRTEKVTVTFGGNLDDGKGNIEGYLSYINQSPVRQGAYDTESCTVASTFGAAGANGHFCLGSSNSAYGNFQGNFYGSEDAQGNWVSSNTLNPVIQSLSNNPNPTNFVDYNTSPPGAVTRDYNFAPLQYLQRQDTRYQGGYFAQYNINDHIQAYSDLMYEQDSTQMQLAPSGLFTDDGAINQIDCADPLMTPAQQQAVCGPNAGNANVLSAPFAIGYRLQNEPRDYFLTHQSYKIDLGFRGSINDAWSYDVYAQYGRTDSSYTIVGDVSLSKIANALDAIPDGSGGAMCASSAARTAGCIPLNIFTPLSAGVTPQQFKYIEEDGSLSGYTTEQVVSANVVGKLGTYGIKSPWATDGVGVALGAEYRRDYLNDTPDAAFTSGDLSGSGIGGVPMVSGSTNVKELYGELSVPIVADRFLMKDVSLDASYRSSDYNFAGDSGTWKVGGDWALTDDLRFRGAYARTERAPNVVELFVPASIGGESFGDPCAGPTPAVSAAACYRTSNLAAAGVSETAFANNIYGHILACPADACNVKLGGNQDLKPEVAYTTTIGAVFTPRFIPGLYASVDYWDIDVLDAVGTLSPTSILNGCYAADITNLCNDISRDPVTGSLSGANGYVLGISQNLTSIHKRGWDFQTDYRFRLKDTGFLPDWGTIDTNFVGTYVDFSEITVPTEGSYDCAGLFGPTCGEPNPRWRHKIRWTWATPWNVDLSLQWRYLAQVKADINSSNPNLGFECCTVVDGKIPAYSYFDLAGDWRVFGNLTLRAGVNNIFDKNPPVLDTIFLGLAASPTNSWPMVYDPLGRTIFISLTAKF